MRCFVVSGILLHNCFCSRRIGLAGSYLQLLHAPLDIEPRKPLFPNTCTDRGCDGDLPAGRPGGSYDDNVAEPAFGVAARDRRADGEKIRNRFVTI